jgi:hypothetical protein
MCLYGTYKFVNVINEQNNKRVKVDACIADEVQELNNLGVITLGCCCGHGRAGQIVEWENNAGKWKSYAEPSHALIRKDSIEIVERIGYRPFPYLYADGENHNVWQMFLKTGCLTMEEVNRWHQNNNLPFEKNIGVIAGR